MASTEAKAVSGVSLTLLTGAAVLATIVGRGVAPSIRGLAVGIAPFIAVSDTVAAFLSQLVAAGGVAAAFRLAAGALRLPKLDLGFRLVALPASAIVVALVMAAWARPLSPELCQIMALAAIGAALTSAIASLRVRETRACGLVLASAGLSGIAHLLARQLLSRPVVEGSGARWAVALASLAALLDLLALGLTLMYLAQGKSRRVAIVAAGVVLPALALGAFAAYGSAPGASPLRVLSERTLEKLSTTPWPLLPSALRLAIPAMLMIAAAWCVLKPGDRGKASVVLGLSLLSLGAPDMPLPALWLLVASLLSPKHLEPSALPAGERVVGRST